MTAPPRGGPPKNETGPEGPAPTTSPNAVTESTCSTGRCAIDELCLCDFYADWLLVAFPAVGSVAEQLRRRRQGAYRLPRLECGRRDPISTGRW